jgi:hypothetical protein
METLEERTEIAVRERDTNARTHELQEQSLRQALDHSHHQLERLDETLARLSDDESKSRKQAGDLLEENREFQHQIADLQHQLETEQHSMTDTTLLKEDEVSFCQFTHNSHPTQTIECVFLIGVLLIPSQCAALRAKADEAEGERFKLLRRIEELKHNVQNLERENRHLGSQLQAMNEAQVSVPFFSPHLCILIPKRWS